METKPFIEANKIQHSSGLSCYPNPDSLTRLSETTLRKTGLSNAKYLAMKRLVDSVPSQQLLSPTGVNAENMAETLLSIKGIGPWTVSYSLLKGFNWLDGSLHGDVAVRRNLQKVLNLTEKPDAKFTETWLSQFSPWRALAAAHLWAIDEKTAY
ncbi:hypothetical protein CS022_23940 [Veronia nyctiphanis]|uniref:DNA-3-methyladenine glycosylase II n=1 Tax=Veronia nyctiphanis TaxID=1278244 RepID=A0A4Q0YEU9_9GAMM|nr:hypothetical protein [Veronia nyctiphanis]RXJ69047.1 hypothetical protein CS022_23940 [Veronia nyctiphanis]